MKQEIKHTALAFICLILFGCTSTSPTPTVGNNTQTPPIAKEIPVQPAVSTPASPTTTTPSTIYTLAEVAKHNSETDCWMAINGNVYKLTDFIASGGHNALIIEGCGLDATAMFQQQEKHGGAQAQSLLPQLQIGTLQ